jgi:hypothetical protein
LSGSVYRTVRLKVLAGFDVRQSTSTVVRFPDFPSSLAVAVSTVAAASVLSGSVAAWALSATRVIHASLPPLRKNWRTA